MSRPARTRKERKPSHEAASSPRAQVAASETLPSQKMWARVRLTKKMQPILNRCAVRAKNEGHVRL
jgi:hypothetical protein